MANNRTCIVPGRLSKSVNMNTNIGIIARAVMGNIRVCADL